MKRPSEALMAALAFFAVWTFFTWFFEGRIGTLLRPDAIGARIVYALAVNLLLGIIGGIVLLRFWTRRRDLDSARAGFRPGKRTVLAISAGLVLGLSSYLLQGAPSTDPVVVVNAFAQVFVVSAAEVVVCWAVVAVATQCALQKSGKIVSGLVAAAVSSLLFGFYHYAHSPPFNTLPMVALLSGVGLVTAAFFLVSRDIAGTIVFHNFLGTFGVINALANANANATQSLEQWQPPLLFTAGLSAVAIGVGYVVLGRPFRSDQPKVLDSPDCRG